MRVGFVTFEFPPEVRGGAGVYAASITRALGELGHRFTVFTPDSSLESRRASLSVNMELVSVGDRLGPFPRALQFWLQLPGALLRMHKRAPFDILHFNGLSYWFARRRPLPMCAQVATIHHLVADARRAAPAKPMTPRLVSRGENSPFLPIIEERCVRSVDSVIAVSQFTRDRLLGLYGLPPGKISVVHHGVRILDESYPPRTLASLRARFGLGQDPVVLFVGRIDDPRKGLGTLLLAFRRVRDTVRANLLVVGGGRDKRVRELVSSLDLTDCVRFAGWVDDQTLGACYALCDLFVSPSFLEGFGLALLEAMAAGKPIVATASGGESELIKAEESGILVKPADVGGIARAILCFLLDRDLARKTGERNRAKAAREFQWERAARLTERVYDSVLDEPAMDRAAVDRNLC